MKPSLCIYNSKAICFLQSDSLVYFSRYVNRKMLRSHFELLNYSNMSVEFPIISNLKKPAYASKRDVLELAFTLFNKDINCKQCFIEILEDETFCVKL